jgi:very-short-patch-repair endonuclease
MSELTASMAFQIRAAKLPAPQQEYRFHPKRKWRFDFAWPDRMLALECEGGAWIGGRHTRGGGFIADCEKYNTATLMGWRVLRVVEDQIRKGRALRWVEGALNGLDSRE